MREKTGGFERFCRLGRKKSKKTLTYPFHGIIIQNAPIVQIGSHFSVNTPSFERE